MNKQTSSKISTAASQIMQTARNGGPIVENRSELISAMERSLTSPKHYPHAVSDNQRRLDAIKAVLQPYFDAAESVAGSALVQDQTKGQTGGR